MKNHVSWAKLKWLCASPEVVGSSWDGFPCPYAAVGSPLGAWGWAGAIR